MNGREEWLTTLPNGSAFPETTTRRLPLRFTGSGSEYFRIWAVNMLLTLITFTLYWPFARARRIAYFQSNTRVGKDPLAFHANPWKMFRGYLLMLGLAGLYVAVGHWAPSLSWLPLLVFASLWPALWRASLCFRLHNSSWRGVRMGFEGSTLGAYAVMLPLFVPALILVWFVPTMDAQGQVAPADFERWTQAAAWVMAISALLMPWVIARWKRYQQSGYSFAGQRTVGHFSTMACYGLAMRALGLLLLMFVGLSGVALLLMHGLSMPAPSVFLVVGVLAYAVVPMILVPWFTARLQNLLWNHTASRHVRFHSELSFSRLLRIHATNWLLIVLTLGLFWPFAQVRAARERLQALTVHIEGDLRSWLASARGPSRGVLGDAAGDFFGMDVGL